MKNNILVTILLSAIFCLPLIIKAQLLQPVTYKDGTQKLNGFIGVPKITTKKKAGVLIIPAWMGVDVHSQLSAEKLAAEGYYAFVADIYGEGNMPNDYKKAGELSGYYKSHVDIYRRRIQLALNALIETGADPNNIVVIGYCFGGTGALEAARANMAVKGVVSFHGGLARDTSKSISIINAKVLACHGAVDPFVPEAQVKAFQNEMNQSKADWQMVYYANAVHAFTDISAGNDPSKGAAYNEKAAKRSWRELMAFLKEVFGEL
jgi:dienelactone hydrolase